MITHAYILCYNEALMIRHTLNHYTGFCQQVVVFDNGSDDGTLNIIANEYPQVIVEDYNTNGLLCDDVYTDIKNRCWHPSRGHAHWVVVCDADEILYHPNLKNILLDKYHKQDPLPLITGYNMVHPTFPADYTKPIYASCNTGLPAASFNKQIIFNPNWIEEINYSTGAHACNPTFAVPFAQSAGPLYLLHYKYMGRQFLYAKHAMYAKRMSEQNKLNNWGGQYLKGNEFVDECFNLFEHDANKKPKALW